MLALKTENRFRLMLPRSLAVHGLRCARKVVELVPRRLPVSVEYSTFSHTRILDLVKTNPRTLNSTDTERTAGFRDTVPAETCTTETRGRRRLERKSQISVLIMAGGRKGGKRALQNSIRNTGAVRRVRERRSGREKQRKKKESMARRKLCVSGLFASRKEQERHTKEKET